VSHQRRIRPPRRVGRFGLNGVDSSWAR
jgi:hypothetical protein